MNQQATSSPLSAPNELSSQGISIDIKRIIYEALRYWYFILTFLFLCLLTAFISNRYAVRIYPVTASILIKGGKEISGGDLLYSNSLLTGSRNYFNELYIIRSYPLIGRTIDKMNFETSFYREGSFLTSEAYKVLPIQAEVFSEPNSHPGRFHFEILNEEQFKLTQLGRENEEISAQQFSFNDTIQFAHLRMFFRKNSLVTPFKNEVFLFTYTPVAWLTGSYVSKLHADWAEEGSGVINLYVNGPYPQKEIDFLKGLIHEYQAYDLENKNSAASRTIDFIAKQLTNISDSLKGAERQLEMFKSKNIITDMNSEARRLYQKLETFDLQKTELVIRDRYYIYLEDYIGEGKGLDQIILPTSMGVADPVLSTQVIDMVEAETQVRLFSQDKIQNYLVKEKLKKIDEAKKNILESVKGQRALDKIKLEFLDKNIRDLEKMMNRLPLAERQLVSIQRNYSLLDNLYVFLLQKSAEAGISKAATTSDIIEVNPPMQSGSAISPKPSNNYILALFIGLGIPTLVLLLIELLNTRVQSREDIEKLSSIPFIGGIGHKKGPMNLEVLNAPKSAIAESFRALRSNLNFFTGNQPKNIFMITSSISGEGKTFTSINLASVFAISGIKVLIVGADLRKPKLYADFGLHNETGLSTYLAGMSDFDAIVQPTSYPHLHLISGGPVPPNPSELLLSRRMAEFIATARERYDCIILDTPPLAIVTDAFEMAEYADHILFMVRQNYTPKILLRNIQDLSASGKLKKVSLVLNDIYKSGPGYGYGYGYGGYGYGYGYGKHKNGYGYYTESN